MSIPSLCKSSYNELLPTSPKSPVKMQSKSDGELPVSLKNAAMVSAAAGAIVKASPKRR